MSDELLDLPLDDLLGKYWEIAYSEGKTGESRGTEAQQVLSSILWAVRALQIEADNYEVEAKRYRFLRGSRDATADNGIPWCVRLVREHGMPTSVVIGGAMLDLVIDAAIARDKL